MYDSDYDFDFSFRYTADEIEEAANWNLFVTPEGTIYPTKPNCCDYYKGSYNCHRDWARQYCVVELGIEEIDEVIRGNNKDDGKSYISGPHDYLVSMLGWISVGYSNLTGTVFLSAPYEKSKMTNMQKDIVFKYCQINKYDLDEYYFKVEDRIPDKYHVCEDDRIWGGE